MRKTTMLFLTGLLLIANLANAASGDLIVDGMLGVGTATPGAKLDVNGDLYVKGAIGINQHFGSYSVQSGIRELFRVSQSRFTTGGTFTISATRSYFVHTSQWAWSSNHYSTGRGVLTQISSSEYSNIIVYLDVAYDGSVIVSADWGAPQDYSISIQKTAGNAININNYGTDWTTVSAANYTRARIVNTINAGFQTANGAFNGVVTSNGVALTSDAVFKKNILPISTPLDKVLNLTGLTYEWKNDEYKEKGFAKGRHYGVIAQEIEKVLPEVVNTAPDGTKAVAYTEIIPVLIEAIKEQQKQIIELKKRLDGAGK